MRTSRPGATPRGAASAFVLWPTPLHVVLVAALLAGAWAVAYAAGGSRTAFPHIFYLPIVVAALPFGIPGGVAVGVVSTVLAGPALPLNTSTGEAQELANWLIRGGFFLSVGALAGTSTAAMKRGFAVGLTRQLRDELELATAPDDPGDDPGLERSIQTMLDNHAFESRFQPIYALDDGRLVAVEALTCFHADPTRPPDDWFRRAATVGLGTEVELAAVLSALEASAGLPSDVAMSFNVSPTTLADPRLLDLLTRFPRRNLIAEVTEHAFIEDYRALDGVIASLRRRGIRLAVDDAGAGFASLRHIVRLNPEFIKLDASLTQNLGDDPIRGPLADCLLQFAERTGSKVIAEGIETAGDLATWRAKGAHAVQGYLLGRAAPLPAAASIDVARPGELSHR